MLYGVAFTQSCDNNLVGVLMFKNEAKAKLVHRVMLGMEELRSLDEKLNSVLESSDFEDVPEFEEYEIQKQMIIDGKKVVNIINFDEIPDIE